MTRPRGGRSILAVALLAGAGLVLWPAAARQPAAGEVRLGQAWPGVAPGDTPGSVPDGPAYAPLLFLDRLTSVGTAPSPDGRYTRLLLRSGAPRELRRLPYPDSPQFGGFTLAGDELAWAESTADREGRAVTRIWAVRWRTAERPRMLTADTGDVAFVNSQYDLVVADGRLHWVAVAQGAQPVTELRSVALSGGATTVRKIPGAWALARWPWLASAGTGQIGPTLLRNLQTGKEIAVAARSTELLSCGPAWCRVLVLAGDGPARTDLMRVDGSDRRRVGDGSVTASIIDVAVLDRFEVLSRPGTGGSPTSGQELLLYDIAKRRTVVVATGVGMILCRGGLLWWSTGDNEALVWHVLDLRGLR